MRNAFVLAGALAAILPALAAAQLPSPLRSDQHSLPGALAGPMTAASAGVGLADRWLADAPFDNPAVRPRGRLALTPSLQRMSRQDLRAANREFDEQLVFFDAAGLWGGFEALGVMWSAYAGQPVVRLEDHAFVRGTFDSPEPPAIIEGTTSARELRAGLGISTGWGVARVGIAGEWTRRDDRYEQVEQSGSPDAGTRIADFSGDGIGGTAGVRLDLGGGGPGSVTAGASARFVPELELEGERTADLVSGQSAAPIVAVRESGWEGGASARVVITPAFSAVAGLSGRTAQAWEGFGVETGTGFAWSLAGAFHDPEATWHARVGVGQEQQRGVPEPRAGVVGIGMGWEQPTWTLDVGLLRRSIERAGRPTSFDDRLLATYTILF